MSEPGSTFDLRYEYFNQNQPRSGKDKVAVGQIPHDHDEGLSPCNHGLTGRVGLAQSLDETPRQWFAGGT